MDKYERVRVVGRGAFGTVYLCLRRRDYREVIVKQGLTLVGEPLQDILFKLKFNMYMYV